MKSGTQKVLLSVPRPIVAGSGISLCSGPLSSVPSGSFVHPVGLRESFGRSKPEKSSFAVGLNSTSRVSSLACCTFCWPARFAVVRGLMPLVVASASRLPSSLAAGGKPVVVPSPVSLAWLASRFLAFTRPLASSWPSDPLGDSTWAAMLLT